MAIKLSVLDHILKPVSSSGLNSAISKVQEALEKEKQISLQIETCIDNLNNVSQDKKLILNTNENVFVVEIKELIHCEANENYTNILIEGKKRVFLKH